MTFYEFIKNEIMSCLRQARTMKIEPFPSPLDGGGCGWPPAQAPPQLPARRVLQLGERGFCPGGRALGSERGEQ